jgi:hypothetical protein
MVVILAGVAAILAVPLEVARNPRSLASLALGTDDAFVVSGMEPRENQIGGGALRWLRPLASFRFEAVGPGPVDIDLEVRGHRTEVTLVANGARIGSLPEGAGHFATRVALSGSSLVLGIETEGFNASGRALGTQFVSLSATPALSTKSGISAVPARLWLALGGVVVVTVAAVAISGLGGWAILAPPVVFLLLVLPAGLWRSRWLFECAILVAVAVVVSVLIARAAHGGVWARTCLQVTLFVAATIHGILPPSPLVIQGDAQLHGNKLTEVARGNRFPTSRTDHQPPFEIPYGFSFYGVLTPWSTPGASGVPVVRIGAAFFSTLSVLALALLLGRTSAAVAAAAVILWTFAPVNIRTMGFGNLSNVFAQAVFLLFLVVGGLLHKGWFRALVLSLLVLLSATAHLSSFIVLFTLLLVAGLLGADRRGPAFKPLVVGVAVALGYFATFLPMVAAQLPRLLGERGGSSGVFDPGRLPSQFVAGAGWPLLALLALSLLTSAPRLILPMSRALAVTALVLAVAALVSPVEVRYLLAALPLLAMLGASALEEDTVGAFPRQTLMTLVDLPGLRTLGSELVRVPVGITLLLAAGFHGLRVLLEFIPLSGV